VGFNFGGSRDRRPGAIGSEPTLIYAAVAAEQPQELNHRSCESREKDADSDEGPLALQAALRSELGLASDQ
jgi:hypothetical protein